MSGALTREPRPAPAREGDVGARRSRIVDPDPRRAAATEDLLGALAPALGLSVGSLRVHADGEAAGRTRGLGARGLAAGGAIWLDPARYDPGSRSGRALLAHEAAHVAQRAETRTRPDRRPPSLAEAEREAATVAQAVLEGRPPPLPVATLPLGAVAADTGVAVAEPQPQAAPTPEPLETYRGWSRELDALVDAVRKVHARRIAQIEDKLDGLWISDGDVDDVLTILEPIPYEHAAALVRGLPDPRRRDLADNISPSHRRQFRTTVLAVTAGLLPSELYTRRDAFDAMPLVQLSVEERFLAVVVLLGLAPSTRTRLLTDPARRDEFVALLAGNAPDAGKLADQRKERRAAIETQRATEEGLDRDIVTQDRLDLLQTLLRDPTAQQAGKALDLLGGMLPAAAPETDTAPAEAPATAPAEAAPTAPAAPPPPPPEFRYMVERLEQTGAIDRMLRALPEREWAPEGARGKAFVAVVGQRPPDANVRLALELLGTGLFNAISAAEARLAYEVVRALPLAARDRFLRRDEGIWLERLEANLPPDILGRADFADLTDVEGAPGRAKLLTEGGGAEVLKQILATLDRGVGAGAASRVLGDLMAIKTPEVRQAVVRRLDTLGQLEPVIDALPDHILLSEDSRPALTAVLGDRDTYHLERHVRRLLSTGVLDWAVTSREAFVAFLLLRAMPAADRERFGRLDFVVGELSAEMRASAGLNLIPAKTAVQQRDGVRDRLGDERLWVGEHAPELRALIAIADALGDRRWVFEESKRRRAWEDPGLRPIVSHFELYDPDAKRTEFIATLEQKAGFFEDYGAFSAIRTIAGMAYFVVREGFRGDLFVDPWAGKAGARDLPLDDLQRALGEDVAGVRISEHEGERRAATNELTVVWDHAKGTLHLELPALELDSIAWVGSTYTVRTGAVSARGIKIDAQFATDDLSHPRSADIGVASFSLADVLYGGEDVGAISRVQLTGIGAHGDVGTEPPRPPSTGMLRLPLLGPIIEVVRLLAKAGGSDSAGMMELRGLSVELGSFELEGVAYGGTLQIASVAGAGVRLAWGGTRAQYLRALVPALTRRVAAAAGPERDRLDKQLDDAKKELAGLEESDRRLLALIRRSHADPASLNDDDQREIVALQQQGPGGVVVDTGPITVRGVGGAVTAREITVDRISGQGEAPAFTLALLTDQALVARFLRAGPDPLQGMLGKWTGEFELGSVSAVDVAMEGKIPTLQELEEQRRTLEADQAPKVQPQMYQRIEDRMTLLDMAIDARRQYDELAAIDHPTPAQAELRRALHTTLAEHFGYTADRVQLGGAKLVGRGDKGLPEQLQAASLEVTGVKAGSRPGTVGKIAATDLKGTGKPISGGWAIDGLEVGELSLDRVDWGTSTKRIVADQTVVVKGLKADVTATTEGEGDAAASVYGITKLDIAEIAIPMAAKTPALIYEDFESGLRAELFAGAVRGVWARDLTIRMDSQTTTFGASPETPALGFDQFDALRFAAAFGDSFRVGGVLTSPEGGKALGITLLGTDQYAFYLKNLTLTDGVVTTPDGKVRIVRLPMSGTVTYGSKGKESDIGLKDFTVPDLVLGNIDWNLTEGAKVTARGRTKLTGITATASIHRDAKGTAGATVDDVRIMAIEAEDLRYTKGPFEVRVNRASTGGRPPLDVTDVQIKGLIWERGADEKGHLTGGQVNVQQANAGLEAQFTAGLATGNLSARTISVRFLPGGRFTARAKELDAIGDIAMGKSRAAVGVTDLDASVEVGPKQIRINATSAAAIPGRLRAVRLTVPTLDFTVAGVDLELKPGGTIDLENFTAGVTLDLNEPDPTNTTKPSIRRVTLDALDLPLLTASRLRVHYPLLFTVELTDPTSPARVEGLQVKGLALDQDDSGTWSMAGYESVKADAIRIDWANVKLGVAELRKMFGGAPGPTPTIGAAAVPFADLLDSLDGHVNFDLVLPVFVDAPVLGWTRVDNLTQPNFPVRITIRRGIVDLAAVVADALGWELERALDFDLHGSRLVLEVDPGILFEVVGGGIAGPIGRTLLRTELAHWDLTTAELARLPGGLNIDLGASPPVPLSVFRITQYGTPPGPPATWLRIDSPHLELHNIDARLSARNASSLPITIAGLGTITLAPVALTNLRIAGDLPGVAPLRLGVDELDIESLALSLSFGNLATKRVLLDGLTDGELTFTGLDPQVLTCRIARFRILDLDLQGTKAKPLP